MSQRRILAMTLADLTNTQLFLFTVISTGIAYAVARSIQRLKESRSDW
jgi:hypothetical protein